VFGTGALGSALSPFGGSSSGSVASSTATASTSNSFSAFIGGGGGGGGESKSIFGSAQTAPSQAKSPFSSTGTASAFGTGTLGSMSPFGGPSSAFGGNAPPAATSFPSSFAPSAPTSADASAPSSAKFGGRNPRDVLAGFYQTHNPSKVSEVDTLLNKYAGREEQMFLALAKKYNLDPSMFGVSAPQPTAAPSTGAMTFGSPATIGFGSTAGFGVAPSGGFGGGTFGTSSGFGSIAQGGGFGSLASSPAGGGFAGFGGGTMQSAPPFGASPFGSARR